MTATHAVARRRLSAEERRAQLADAAISVLAAHGYQSTTVDAIARQAGVSKGLLWHYFTDRDDLLEYAARRTLVTLRQAVGADLDLTQRAPDLIRQAIHRAAALRTTHREELAGMREIVGNLRKPDGSLRLGLGDYEETYALQEDIFRRGQQDGDFRAGLNLRYMAVVYQGAVDTMLDYLDVHSDDDPDRCATAVADILLEGFCRPPAESASIGQGGRA